MTATTAPAMPGTAFEQRAADAPQFQMSIFRGLPSSVVCQLEHLVQVRELAPGELVYASGASVDRIWFVLSGNVRLGRERQGRELTVAILDPGACFGEGAVLGSVPTDDFAQAMGHTRVGSLEVAQVKELMYRFPSIANNLLSHLSERLRGAEEMAERIAYWSLPRRVARLLLELDERYGHPTLDGGRVINVNFTKAQLGTMLAASREEVSRQLSRMRRDNMVASRGRRIVLVDPASIARIAGCGDVAVQAA